MNKLPPVKMPTAYDLYPLGPRPSKPRIKGLPILEILLAAWKVLNPILKAIKFIAPWSTIRRKR
jgi:hypothetical protein